MLKEGKPLVSFTDKEAHLKPDEQIARTREQWSLFMDDPDPEMQKLIKALQRRPAIK